MRVGQTVDEGHEDGGRGGAGKNDRDYFREVFIVARNVKMRFG